MGCKSQWGKMTQANRCGGVRDQDSFVDYVINLHLPLDFQLGRQVLFCTMVRQSVRAVQTLRKDALNTHLGSVART